MEKGRGQRKRDGERRTKGIKLCKKRRQGRRRDGGERGREAEKNVKKKERRVNGRKREKKLLEKFQSEVELTNYNKTILSFYYSASYYKLKQNKTKNSIMW